MEKIFGILEELKVDNLWLRVAPQKKSGQPVEQIDRRWYG
jgi:hypothetical protein